MIKSKKQMIISISAFILVLMLTTVTFAFFNYTRTGTANIIRTGRISFNANQTETINLTNVFPIDKTTIGSDSVNTDETVITITGDTTYTEGIEYLVTAVDVNNTIGSGNNTKTVPISVSVTASNGLGTEDEEYFDNRENANSHLYRVLAKDVLTENGRIAVGYIKAGSTGINGTLTIKAYLDKDKVAITDTYDGNETDNMGTTTEWVDNRETFTTTEWNALQTNGVSFKVKVESNEGIWVNEILSVNAMTTFPTVITDEKANIKEVYFNKMGATRMQAAYDAATIKADLTYNNEGKVLAWLEENPDDNTKYNLIIASDGETFFPSNSAGLFQYWQNMEKIEFNNINTIRVTNMNTMFNGCTGMTQLDVSSFNMENVTSLYSIFATTGLTSIDLSNKGGDNLSIVNDMFGNSGIKKVNMSGFNFGNSNISYAFSSALDLEEVDLSNAIINPNSFTGLFASSKFKVVDLSGIDISNVTNMSWMFINNNNLTTIYVSDTWDVSTVTGSDGMFYGCTSLVGGNGTTFDSTKFDKTMAVIDTPTTPGYLTLKTN